MSYESIRESNEEFDNRTITNKETKKTLEINIKPATITLIIICLVFFLLSQLSPVINQLLSFNKYNLLKNPLVMITSAFLHANTTHLFFNIAVLFFLGTVIELNNSHKMIIKIFLTSVIISNTSFLILFPNNSAIGISGFIYALIGFLIITKPSLKILMPIGFISIPTPIIIAGPVLGIIESVLSFTIADGVAHVAHFSGLITGLIIGIIHKKSITKKGL